MVIHNQICEICKESFTYAKKSSSPNKRTCSKSCSYALRKITRNTIHEPLEKICVDCNQNFLDTSKKKKVERCKSCIFSSMVDSRKLNGSYDRSEEQNQKLSKTLKSKYESGWNPNTLEHRQKLSDSLKSRWENGEMEKKSKETNLKKYGKDHWMKTDQGREFSSVLHKDRKYSQEIKIGRAHV